MAVLPEENNQLDEGMESLDKMQWRALTGRSAKSSNSIN